MVLSSSVACQPCKPAIFMDEETEVAPTPFFVGELEFEPSNPALEPEHRTSILSSSDRDVRPEMIAGKRRGCESN